MIEFDGYVRFLMCTLPANLPRMSRWSLGRLAVELQGRPYDESLLTQAADTILQHLGFDRVNHRAQVSVIAPDKTPRSDGFMKKGGYHTSTLAMLNNTARIDIVDTRQTMAHSFGHSYDGNIATLCHEITHHVLHSFSLRFQSVDREERLTDSAMIFLGLGWHLFDLRPGWHYEVDSEFAWDERVSPGYLTWREAFYVAARAADLTGFNELAPGLPEGVGLAQIQESESTPVDLRLDQLTTDIWRARRQLHTLRSLQHRTPTQYRKDRADSRAGTVQELTTAMQEQFLHSADERRHLDGLAAELANQCLARAAGHEDVLATDLNSIADRVSFLTDDVNRRYEVIESYYRIDWQKGL